MHIGVHSTAMCRPPHGGQFAVVQWDLLLRVRTHLKWGRGSVGQVCVSAYQCRWPHSGTLSTSAGRWCGRLLTDLSVILQDIGRVVVARHPAPGLSQPDVAATLPLMFFRSRRCAEGLTDGRGGGGCFTGLRRTMSEINQSWCTREHVLHRPNVTATLTSLIWWPATDHWPLTSRLTYQRSR